jgi:pectate lyase-like protein
MSHSNVRIIEMPDLGSVTDASSFVAEKSGSGRMTALALRSYVTQGLYVSAKHYGAEGDGVTDDTVAIQDALDTERSVYLPEGSYRVTSGLQFKANGQRLFSGCGGGWSTVLEWEGSAGCISALGLQYCSVDGLHIRRPAGLSTITSGHAVVFGPQGAADAYRCQVRNCRIENTGNAILLQGTEHRLSGLEIINIHGSYGIRFFGTDTHRSYRAVVSDILCNNSDGSDSTVWILYDSYAYSLVLASTALINGGVALQMRDIAATGSSYPMWVLAWDMECDHNKTAGIALQAGEGAYITTSWIGSCLTGNGVYTAGDWRGELSLNNCRLTGNYQHGVLLGAGVDTLINGCVIGDNSAESSGLNHGITIGAGISRVAITGCRLGDSVGVAGNNQGYGVYVATGASDYYQVVGNIISGNATGGVSDNGTGTHKFIQS